MLSEFPTAIVKASGHWNNSFKVLKENDFQPRILYPAELYWQWRFSDKYNQKKKLFDDEQNWKKKKKKKKQTQNKK